MSFYKIWARDNKNTDWRLSSYTVSEKLSKDDMEKYILNIEKLNFVDYRFVFMKDQYQIKYGENKGKIIQCTPDWNCNTAPYIDIFINFTPLFEKYYYNLVKDKEFMKTPEYEKFKEKGTKEYYIKMSECIRKPIIKIIQTFLLYFINNQFDAYNVSGIRINSTNNSLQIELLLVELPYLNDIIDIINCDNLYELFNQYIAFNPDITNEEEKIKEFNKKIYSEYLNSIIRTLIDYIKYNVIKLNYSDPEQIHPFFNLCNRDLSFYRSKTQDTIICCISANYQHSKYIEFKKS